MLLDGEEISDELYVKVFVTKLRIQYPYKDPKTKQSEVKQQARRQVEINERLRSILSELQKEDLKRKQIKALEAEQVSLQEELQDLQVTEPIGWVLVDFPASYAQAKLLEEALSEPQARLPRQYSPRWRDRTDSAKTWPSRKTKQRERRLEGATIVMDRKGRSKGYGFVKFLDPV